MNSSEPVLPERSPRLWVFLGTLAIFIIAGLLVYFLYIQKFNQPSPLVAYAPIKDSNQWNQKPVPVTDIDLGKDMFLLSPGYFQAWDVGVYKDPGYISTSLDNSRILIAVFRDFRENPMGQATGSGACDQIGRLFLGTAPSGNIFVRFDTKYSPDNILLGGYSGLSKDHDLKAKYFFENTSGAYIPSLDFPGFVVHSSQVFVREPSFFPCYAIDSNNKTTIFFDDISSSLQPSFMDAVLGQAYQDKTKGDIVFRAADGTYTRYQEIK